MQSASQLMLAAVYQPVMTLTSAVLRKRPIEACNRNKVWNDDRVDSTVLRQADVKIPRYSSKILNSQTTHV
jgi:hypothetical protein